jgi:HlyD family secretion protein
MFNRTAMLGAALTFMVLVVACQTAPTGIPTRPAAVPTNQPTVVSEAADTIEVQGVFTAPNQATLTFKSSGRLTEVRVQEGTTVKKGDTLAALDKTELQLSVQQAQAALIGAQAHLNQAQTPATNADTAAAQAAVDAALKNYEKVRAGPTPNDLAALKAQVDNAKAVLDQAQAAYDKIGGATNPNIGMLPQSVQLQTAFNNYNATLAAFNNARTHPTAAELATAWQQVQQAQDALSRLQPTSDNIAIAQAAVDQAQAALALAQQQVTNATLTAPFDGTVLSLGPHVGETVGPNTPILTLADLNHLQVQAGVDQDLISQIQIGQTVMMVPDAFKTKPVTGKVSRIGWLATTTAGVTNVPVTMDVDIGGGGVTRPLLRPGLTATVEFNSGE